MALQGHLWTFGPYVAHAVRPKPPPVSRHFRTHVVDPERGRIRLTGRLTPAAHARPRSETDLLIAVHGLGGSHQSHYMVDVARLGHEIGFAVLRINCRGADRQGGDYNHAGLTDDLRAFIESPEVRAYRRVALIGYSLGGHLALRFAAEGAAENVASIAAICPPIDLAAGVAEIDHPKSKVYRRTLLGGLKDIYANVLRRSRAPLPLSLRDAKRIRTIREWDERIVAPRHGFRSADDYYSRATVGPMLSEIRVPTLAVSARHDPVVYDHTVRPTLRECEAIETVFLERGGHVGFPAGVELGHGESGSVNAQALKWLARKLPS